MLAKHLGELSVGVIPTNFCAVDGKMHDQNDCVAMGSPLTPILSNFFMGVHEKNGIQKNYCLQGPLYYRRYVDDIFAVFHHESNVTSYFQNFKIFKSF